MGSNFPFMTDVDLQGWWGHLDARSRRVLLSFDPRREVPWPALRLLGRRGAPRTTYLGALSRPHASTGHHLEERVAAFLEDRCRPQPDLGPLVAGRER